jgi:hypothetical protein
MTLDIWSKKVFSKLFFKHENANPDRIQKEASRRWDNYKGLGALYLMEYLYYKGKVNSKGNAGVGLEIGEIGRRSEPESAGAKAETLKSSKLPYKI